MYTIMIFPADPVQHKAFIVPHVDRTIAIEVAIEYAGFPDVARVLVTTHDEHGELVMIYHSICNPIQLHN